MGYRKTHPLKIPMQLGPKIAQGIFLFMLQRKGKPQGGRYHAQASGLKELIYTHRRIMRTHARRATPLHFPFIGFSPVKNSTFAGYFVSFCLHKQYNKSNRNITNNTNMMHKTKTKSTYV